MLASMNNELEEKVSYGEFLNGLGLWFIMVITNFDACRDFWSTQPIAMLSGASYQFNDIMSRNHFEALLTALKFTDQDPPAYQDLFWEVCQMIDKRNKNMAEKVSPSWISCLDESMSKWLCQWTCPGFMCVSRKPGMKMNITQLHVENPKSFTVLIWWKARMSHGNAHQKNNSLIIDVKSIPKGLMSSHFHVGCTTGWNDLVRILDLISLTICHLKCCGYILGYWTWKAVQ